MQYFQVIASLIEQPSSSHVPTAMQKSPRLGKHGSTLCGHVLVKLRRSTPRKLAACTPWVESSHVMREPQLRRFALRA